MSTSSSSSAPAAAAAAQSPPGARRVSPVVLRTVTGACHPSNRGAVDWSSPAGLLAFACNTEVVAVDPATMQVAQVMDGHRATVTRVAWTRAPTTRHPADR